MKFHIILIHLLNLILFNVYGEITSASDRDVYRNFCREAATSDSVFRAFKRNQYYIQILQGEPYSLGIDFVSEIEKKFSREALSRINWPNINDEIGSPQCYDFPLIGTSCPATIRYFYFALDILQKFDNLLDSNIVEIGGGYGGQCFIFSQLNEFNSYHIFDLPEVNKLTEKYVRVCGLKNVYSHTLDEEIRLYPIDLVISNFAFSECCKSVQDLYLEKVIQFSKQGYMVYNSSPDAYTYKEIVTKLENYNFDVKVETDFPKSNHNTIRIVFRKT